MTGKSYAEIIAAEIHRAGWNYDETQVLNKGKLEWHINARKTGCTPCEAMSTDLLRACQALQRKTKLVDSMAALGKC